MITLLRPVIWPVLYFVGILGCSNANAVDRVDVFVANDLLTEAGKRGFNIDELKKHIRAPISVYNIQEISNLEQSLSDGLPKDKDQALAIMRKRFNDPKYRPALNKVNGALGDYLKMVSYKVIKIPAVVFDGHYIVYGETPLKSYKIYKKYIRKNGG